MAKKLLVALALLGCLGATGGGCKRLPTSWGDPFTALWFAVVQLDASTVICPPGVGPTRGPLQPNETRWWSQRRWLGVPDADNNTAPSGNPPTASIMEFTWEGSVPADWSIVYVAVEWRDGIGRDWQKWGMEYGIFCPWGPPCEPIWVITKMYWPRLDVPNSQSEASVEYVDGNGCSHMASGYLDCIGGIGVDCKLPIFANLVGQ